MVVFSIVEFNNLKIVDSLGLGPTSKILKTKCEYKPTRKISRVMEIQRGSAFPEGDKKLT